MKKKVISMLLVTAMTATMAIGCGSSDDGTADGDGGGETAADDGADASADDGAGDDAAADDDSASQIEFMGDVSLTMWGAEEDQEMLQGMIDAFKEEYKDVANWDIQLGVLSESDARDTVTTDVEAAADVYAFASDQIQTLYKAGALQEVQLNTQDIIDANGGADAGAVKAAMIDGKLYAYPMTSGNTYFLFYNKEFISDEDAKELDKILEVAADNGKKFSMEMTSGWYSYSFFGGAGFELTRNDDNTNSCNFNETSATGIKGTDVLQAMIDICKNPGFKSMIDSEFQTAVADGSVVAGINGTWNAELCQKTWGENYAATKLPTYTCNGEQVQMYSFAGYKMVGVNPYCDNVGAAMMLAEWITNEENQKTRFEVRGAAPTNANIAATDEVQQNLAVAACSAQDPYTILDGCQSDQYWDPMTALGGICVEGTDKDLQTVLDDAVAGITQAGTQ